MLASARWPVNLGIENDLCCSCERLLVSDTIGAKSEVWGNRDGNKERIAGDQRSGGGEWAGHPAGDGAAVGGRGGGRGGMGAGGGLAFFLLAFFRFRRSSRGGGK